MSFSGSGCPEDYSDVKIDTTGTVLEVTFARYVVETGTAGVGV
ncbi:DUF4360 domain-containing protein [Streptomyces sp. NPDC001373]